MCVDGKMAVHDDKFTRSYVCTPISFKVLKTPIAAHKMLKFDPKMSEDIDRKRSLPPKIRSTKHLSKRRKLEK